MRLEHHFQVKRSKVNLQGAGAYCGSLPHSLFVYKINVEKKQDIDGFN